MSSEAAQQVPHTLDERIRLRMNENFRNEILARILDETFAYDRKDCNEIT